MAFNNIHIDENGVWTKITTDLVGRFSLSHSGQYCVYDGVPPADLIGHRYSSDLVDFSLQSGESIYVKSFTGGYAIGNVIDGLSVLLAPTTILTPTTEMGDFN